jgi:hypothetical protein
MHGGSSSSRARRSAGDLAEGARGSGADQDAFLSPACASVRARSSRLRTVSRGALALATTGLSSRTDLARCQERRRFLGEDLQRRLEPLDLGQDSFPPVLCPCNRPFRRVLKPSVLRAKSQLGCRRRPIWSPAPLPSPTSGRLARAYEYAQSAQPTPIRRHGYGVPGNATSMALNSLGKANENSPIQGGPFQHRARSRCFWSFSLALASQSPLYAQY